MVISTKTQLWAEDMVDYSNNFLLYNGGRQKRGGTTHVSSTKLPSAGGKQLGIYDYQVSLTTRHTLVHTDEGKLYSDYNSTAIDTTRSASIKSWFETYQGICYITDGATQPITFNGGSTGTFTNYAADWGASNYPAVFIKHGAQASQRLWGMVLGTNKFSVYASGINTDDFSSGVVFKLNIDTHDGIGLVGAAEYGESLMCFGKKKAFIILDQDPDFANWGYQDVQWEGGASQQFLIVKTQNDIICMTDDGDIYSVTTVINYGDYKAASLARPAYIHQWIQDNVDLSQIAKFHAVYDPQLRRVLFFVVRQGLSQVDTALCYWIDRPLPKAWCILDNRLFDSGYSAVSSALIRPSTGVVRVWTGGYTGYSWKTEETSIADDVNPYPAQTTTANDPFDNPRETKHYTGGRAILSPAGNATLGMSWSVDGVPQGVQNLPISLSGDVYGSGVYGTSEFSEDVGIFEVTYDLGQIGKRLQYTFFDNNIGESIYLAEYMTDFRPLGVQP